MDVMIIARDDDAPIHGLKDFIPVHELLRSYNKVHTVALICRNLHRFYEFIKYINSDMAFFDIQFHCLDHIDYSDERNNDILDSHFKEGIKEIYEAFGVRPTVYYPAWNLSSDFSEKVALENGLVTSYKKFSLDQFLRNSETIKESGGVINFHHWSKEERILLQRSLQQGL